MIKLQQTAQLALNHDTTRYDHRQPILSIINQGLGLNAAAGRALGLDAESEYYFAAYLQGSTFILVLLTDTADIDSFNVKTNYYQAFNITKKQTQPVKQSIIAYCNQHQIAVRKFNGHLDHTSQGQKCLVFDLVQN